MKFITLFLSLFIISTFSHAEPASKGDAKIGKTLHDKSCTSCHVSMTGGDGSAIYSRLERKIKNAPQLEARVRNCNVNAGAKWFPEEENHVATYLNNAYYHFK